MSSALDRNALYYPYIHVRDVNWLKATLLCFRQVRRMVPPDFHLNDLPELKPYRALAIEVRGEKMPLLTEERTDTAEVYQAQRRLVEELKHHEDVLDQRFSKNTTTKQFGSKYDPFQIHARKMPDLMEYLLNRKVPLAWKARTIRTNEPHKWFAVHPELGEAIMSVLAIAIAENKSLDIVTSSGTAHHALATLDEEAVINNLLKHGAKSTSKSSTDKNAELVDELAEIVMTTSFNLEKLKPEQILELIKEGKDLREFKKGLIPIVSSIPDIRNPKERKKKLTEAADEVIESWNKYRKGLPYFAAEALVNAINYKEPAVVTRILAGATSGIMLAGGIGLGIALLTFSGVTIWRGYKEKARSPFRYLSRIQSSGATLSVQATPGKWRRKAG
jgi:hypothetical protein